MNSHTSWRKRLRVLVAALLVPVLLTAGQVSAADPAAFDFAAIDAYIESEMDDSRIQGIALAVVEGDNIIHARGFGSAGQGREVTPDTPFPIGSLTKSMTAVAIMQLVEAGQVDLDAPVQRYIPWFQVDHPTASEEITVRHLLNQTSGLSRQTGITPLIEESDASLEETVRDLRTAKLNRAVGETYEYSNANYATLAYLVESISGQPYGEYLQARIFEPLGMDRSTTLLAEAQGAGLTDVYRYWYGFPFETTLSDLPSQEPAFASADDMARYLAMFLGGGMLDGSEVLTPASVAELLTPATNETSRQLLSTEFTFRYGMGWFAGPFGTVEDARWHLGELPSFNAWMALAPESNLGMVILINTGSQLEFGGANEVMSRIPTSVMSMLDGNAPATGRSVTGFYIVFNAVVIAFVAVQLWALVRLALRPVRFAGSRWFGPRWAVVRAAGPLIWEFGVSIAVLIGWPLVTQMDWRGSWAAFPDLTIVLLGIAVIWIATGIVRTMRIGQALERRRRERSRTPVGSMTTHQVASTVQAS